VAAAAKKEEKEEISFPAKLKVLARGSSHFNWFCRKKEITHGWPNGYFQKDLQLINGTRD
jgi:hypothetical protein